MVDTGTALGSVTNIYSLLGYIVLSLTYLIALYFNKVTSKKQNKSIIEKFEAQNDKLIEKIDELKDSKNSLDLQSSMDLLEIIYTKSMLKIMDGVKVILEENNIYDENRKPIILNKVKNIVNTQYDDDVLTLSRIFYKNTNLSTYISELDKNELIHTIFDKINLLNGSGQYFDIMDYIRNKYSHSIQSSQLMISK